MNTFYIIRHGQKTSNYGDAQLTSVGEKQAKETGKYFKDKNISAIFASPTARTKQTAEIISNILNLNFETDDRLLERMHAYDDNLGTWKDFMIEWRKTDVDRDYVTSRGKSARQTGEEMEALIREVNASGEDKNFLIVAHGGIIGDLLRNNFAEEDLPLIQDSIPPGRFIDILECSITVIKLEDGKLVLEKVGDVSHLPIPIS